MYLQHTLRYSLVPRLSVGGEPGYKTKPDSIDICSIGQSQCKLKLAFRDERCKSIKLDHILLIDRLGCLKLFPCM